MIADYYKEVLKRTWKGKAWESWRLASFLAFTVTLVLLHYGYEKQAALPLLIAPFLFLLKCGSVARSMHDEQATKIALLESTLADLTTRRFRVIKMGRRGDGMYYLEIENLDKASSQAFTAKLVQAVDETGTIVAESWRLTGPECLGGMFHVAAGRTVKVNFANKTGDIARLVAEANNVKLPRNDYKIKILIDNARVPTELNLQFDGTHFHLLEGPDNPAIGPL